MSRILEGRIIYAFCSIAVCDKSVMNQIIYQFMWLPDQQLVQMARYSACAQRKRRRDQTDAVVMCY